MGNPTKEQLENIRDELDYVADERKSLEDAQREAIEAMEENGIPGPTACELVAAAQPQPDGKSPARVAIRVILGVDIGEEPPEDEESSVEEESAEEEKAGDGADDEESEATSEETEPVAPAEEQLDAIRDQMQDVCDAWSEFDMSCSNLYDAAEKNGVPFRFVDAAIDAVKDGRTGEDADEAFELAKDEM